MKKNKLRPFLLPAIFTLLTVVVIVVVINIVNRDSSTLSKSENILNLKFDEPNLKFDDGNETNATYETIYDKYDEYLIKKENLLPIKNITDEDNNTNKTLETEADTDDTNESNHSIQKIEKIHNSHFDYNKSSGELPKMLIIVDDVSFDYQVQEILRLNMNLTPSFLPANEFHPTTPKLAKKLDYYMIHLPLEAIDYPKEEIDTLKVSDSVEVVGNRIKSLKTDFPKAKFVNNHTGSKFTADIAAMTQLISIFGNNGLRLIDSKTTKDSVAKVVVESFKHKYLKRDVFLDNEDDKAYIIKQIKKAVKYAKARGFAIVICHPRKSTFEALEESKQSLKGVVDIVNINEAEKFLK